MEIALIVALFIAIIIVFILYKKTALFKSKGDKGEYAVARVLGKSIEGEQYVINDLIFEDEYGNSCQIDHIYINKHGIWVIETKNYSGTIYGSENQMEWMQVLAHGNEKNKLYNPVKQNATHIYRLSHYLKAKGIFQNLVIFLSDANITNVTAPNVYSIDRLDSLIRKDTGIRLTAKQMEYYYNELLSLKNNSSVSRRQHIKNIRKTQYKIKHNICPRCGAKLVLRNGSDGQAFYGCSNFPDCKFTKKTD